jgi:hypothetical protein
MTTTDIAPGAGPFSTPTAFMTIPRVGGLALSADGRRLVATIAELDADGAKFVSSLWELDPAAATPARQLRVRAQRRQR